MPRIRGGRFAASNQGLAFPIAAAGQTVNGHGLVFDGVDDIVSLGLSTALQIQTITVEAWIKPTSTASVGFLVYDTTNSNAVSGGYQLQASSVCVFRKGSDTGYQYLTGTATVNDGSWHHVAGIYSTSDLTVSLYVDGILDAGPTASTGNINYTNSTGLTLGADPAGANPTLYWAGELDEVRIWNVARTQDEIINNKSNHVSTSSPGLIGYWLA